MADQEGLELVEVAAASQDQQQPEQWMAAPQQSPPDCPPGLEYLTDLDQLIIHQQVEVVEAITGFETKNRYRIRNTQGKDVYHAVEASNCLLRQCCGPCRPFNMVVSDSQEREVITLHRPLRCCHWCCFCCLQEVEVQSPPGTTIGYIQQDFTFLYPWFSILNEDRDTLLKLKGPCCCYTCGDVEFEVMSTDGTQSIGKITKQWSGLAKEIFTDADNFGIQIPADLSPKLKAILLGATFLLDFMFFEH